MVEVVGEDLGSIITRLNSKMDQKMEFNESFFEDVKFLVLAGGKTECVVDVIQRVFCVIKSKKMKEEVPSPLNEKINKFIRDCFDIDEIGYISFKKASPSLCR